ncbi:hypothetical protein Hanom_Chr10g00917401 [Helianthus anomalus]
MIMGCDIIGPSRFDQTSSMRGLNCLLPPTAAEGALISNPRPCRAITPAGKEVVYLSNEESVASLEHELKPPHVVFAGVMRNLEVAHKKPEVTDVASNAASRKDTTCIRQCSLGDFMYVSDSFDELYVISCKPQTNVAAGVRCSGSTGSKEKHSSATPTSTLADETEADLSPELIRKNASKRPHEETKLTLTPEPKRLQLASPRLGKKGVSRRFILTFRRTTARPKIIVIPSKSVSTVGEKAVGVKKPLEKTEEVKKGVEKAVETEKAVEKTPEIGHVETQNLEAEALRGSAEGAGASGTGGGMDSPFKAHQSYPSPIQPDNTLADIYYKSYNTDRANDIHAPVWGVKQGDTFSTFGPCQELFTGAFPPGKVLH